MFLRWSRALTEYAERVRSNTAMSYAVAAIALGAAVVVRLLLDIELPGRLLYLAYFPAVTLVALLSGPRPAALVLAVSALIGVAWPHADALTFRFAACLLYLFVGAVIIVLIEAFMTTLARVRRQDAQLVLINQELKHRIKNLFSIANSVCQQTIRSGSSPEDMSKAVSGRLFAIAAAQDLLSVTATRGANLAELVASLVSTVAPDRSRLTVEGPVVHLPAQLTTPFALVLHELATNAVKYGAWAAQKGRVEVSWSLAGDLLAFRWREYVELPLAPAMRTGLGSKLIKDGLPGATVRHDLTPSGLDCEISLPLDPSGTSAADGAPS